MDTPQGGPLARTAAAVARTMGRGARRGGGKTPPLPRSVAQDERLSYRARGLVSELWSRPAGWTFTIAALYAQTRFAPAVEGRDALHAAVSELVATRYVRPVRADGGAAWSWTSRLKLNRAAARDEDDFVHVPWAVARDRRLSYRARGLLTARLSYGTTLSGQTVTVHRGGITALAGQRPVEGQRATTTALGELLALGYAVRERRRDDRGRLDWATVFRSYIPDPVDNSPATDADPTCTDPASPQVGPTMTKPGRQNQEQGVTCGNPVFPQVGTTVTKPGPIRAVTKGSSEGEKTTSGDLSDRTAQEGDARAHVRPLRGTQDHPDPVSEGGRVHPGPSDAVRSRPPVPREAWQALAQLPRPLRDGAPGWVRREMARRLARLIDEHGLTAAAIVATAERVVAERPISGDHIAALRAVHARLAADLAAGDICDRCGGDRFVPHGRCPGCEAERDLDERERAQLAAAWARLRGDAPPGPAPPPMPLSA